MSYLRAFPCLLAAILGLSLFPQAFAYPQPVGRVNDFAHQLSQAQAKALAGEITSFEAKTQHQMAVVTVDSLEGNSVEAYTLGLARAWGVGRAGANDGVVFLVAPNERKCRIEPGLGLDGVLTKAECDRIIQNDILPSFKSGNMPEGILKGARAIMRKLNPPPPPPPLTAEELRARAEARQAAAVAAAEAKARSDAQSAENLRTAAWITLTVAILIAFAFYIRAGLRDRDDFQEEVDATEDILKRLEGDAKTSLPLTAELHRFYSPGFVRAKTEGLVDATAALTTIRKAVSEAKKTFNPWAFGCGPTIAEVTDLRRELRVQAKAIAETREAFVEGRVARDRATNNGDRLPALLDEVREVGKDIRVNQDTQSRLNRAVSEAARLKPLAEVLDWVAHDRHVAAVFSELSQALSAARNEVESFERAPTEGARLLKDLPALLQKLEKSTADSEKAKAQLREAKSKMGQAIAAHRSHSDGGGLSGAEWFMIYMLLSSSSSSANAAAQTATHEAEAAASAAREASRRSYESSSNSSSDCGSASFGGGDFGGGGGGSGSW